MKELNDSKKTALKDLLFRMADDVLILGHRNSEWTALGPILEEDIAFSSMAQDKIGHAFALYQILNSLGEADPDTIAFARNEKDFKSCHLVEYPIGDYNFSLMRHFLFDISQAIRFDMLSNSSFEQLANVAKKFRGELKYHTMHADTWIVQLGNANEESRSLMQTSLNECFPLALGIFEPGDYEQELINSDIFPGEKILYERWIETIKPILKKANLQLPDVNSAEAVYGGRKGYHTEYLKPLIDEMTEVYSIDPNAEW
ncbi:MAG: phenylacetate-CoA oxygenase subunit PaaC [Bacteroidota bacterium]|nr:phenylacetate-CoA oxygenase subunit PaaC [Bacteroidota bacterium]